MFVPTSSIVNNKGCLIIKTIIFFLGSLLFSSSVTQAKQVPFVLCGSENHLGVDQIDISPYPARAGSLLTITVIGKADLDIKNGSRVHMDVREGMLPAPPKDYNLCDVLSDTTCPVKAHTRSTAVFLYNVTRFAPAGTATSTVTATDKDGKVLGCLTVEIDVVRGPTTTTTTTTTTAAAAYDASADGRPPTWDGWGEEGRRKEAKFVKEEEEEVNEGY